MKIPRTDLGHRQRASVWIYEDDVGHSVPLVETCHAGDYPTHSPVLGPDGEALEYQGRPAIGFDMTPRTKGQPP